MTAPLTESEWRSVQDYQSRGWVSPDSLTGDSNHNADLIAGAIACSRAGVESRHLCLSDVATIDSRVQKLKEEVNVRGLIINWAAVPEQDRLSYVMELLVVKYGYSAKAAAGIVGNLFAESGVLPNRIEGSDRATPLRAPDSTNKTHDFTPDEVMHRSATTGPQLPGIGLAQWTSAERRAGLFNRTSDERQLGSSIVFDMDAQVEYLVSELQAGPGFTALNKSLTTAGISVNDASDKFLCQFENPANVEDKVATRRNLGAKALQAFRDARMAKLVAFIKDPLPVFKNAFDEFWNELA